MRPYKYVLRIVVLPRNNEIVAILITGSAYCWAVTVFVAWSMGDSTTLSVTTQQRITCTRILNDTASLGLFALQLTAILPWHVRTWKTHLQDPRQQQSYGPAREPVCHRVGPGQIVSCVFYYLSCELSLSLFVTEAREPGGFETSAIVAPTAFNVVLLYVTRTREPHAPFDISLNYSANRAMGGLCRNWN